MNATLAMSKPVSERTLLLPINAVERETGVSKELLRMWERRYHFPQPQRDAQGDRIYPLEQVNKLRLLRRLIDQGFRPGKIIDLGVGELEGLLHVQENNNAPSFAPQMGDELLEVLKSHDVHRLRRYLSHQLVRMGLQTFIVDFMQYANAIVGDAWMRGLIEVHEEHLYTEQLQMLIRQAISNLRDADAAPHIMITTPPDEQHTLGALMVEALLRLENADAISFGSQMPVRDIVQAVQKHKLQVVALSFSASFPASRAVEFLEELRFRLPLGVQIWAGGSALRSQRRQVPAVLMVNDFNQLFQALANWRRENGVRH